MKKYRSSGRRMKRLLAATALLSAALVTAPGSAEADPTLAAVLGGTALAGLILHASQPAYPYAYYPRYHPTYYHYAHPYTTVHAVPRPVVAYPGTGGYYVQPVPMYAPVQY